MTASLLTVRRLDADVKVRLRIRAAHNGRSMEEEVREILRIALTEPEEQTVNLADSIRKRFVQFDGGVELPIPPRDALRTPPDFSELESETK